MAYIKLPTSHQSVDKLPIVESPEHVSVSGALQMQWSPVTGLVEKANGEISMHVDNKYVITDATGKVGIQKISRDQLPSFRAATHMSGLNTYLQNFKAYPLSEGLDAALLAQRRAYKHRELTPEEQANIEASFTSFMQDIAPIVEQGQNASKKEVSRIQRELADMTKAHPSVMMDLFEHQSM